MHGSKGKIDELLARWSARRSGSAEVGQAMTKKLNEWQEKMKDFHSEIRKEGQGRFMGAVIRREDASWLISSGEVEFFQAMGQWLRYVRDGRRPLCLACEHEFVDALAPAFFLARPHVEAASQVMLTGICGECSSKSDEELLKIAYQGLKEMGLAMEIIHWGQGGRA
jgi:hypothetical protein